MNYLTYGDKKNKSIVLIHGMATTALLNYERILPFLEDYYVVLVQVDGHIEENENVLVSMQAACTDVEEYIKSKLEGEVFCLGGFSMGATMAVEIAGRENIKVSRLFLDAAFLTKMGLVLTWSYKRIFWSSLNWLIKGHKVPVFILDNVMGKGNRAVIEMLFYGVKKATIYNACQEIYTYEVPAEMKRFDGKAMFIYGSNEPYPKKSAMLLKSYIPCIQIKEIKNMGHGQYIMTHPKKYAEMLINFMEGEY